MEDETLVKEAFDDLLNHCKHSDKPEIRAFIEKAFLFADKAHKGMRRKSGEPFILHPIAVARIVAAEIGLGTKSVVAALLHDVVEDTHYTLEDIGSIFGKKIAKIVDGLTKISGVFDNDTSEQAENFRKILLTLSDDIRVIIIKIADRLHNMRTLESMPPRKQVKIASETLFIFAPLAHRLGLRNIKSELEKLSLMYKNPEEYAEIRSKVTENRIQNEKVIEQFIIPIEKKLKKMNYEFTIKSRPKSVYSIWKKMQMKNVSYEDIYDRLAIRIVFDPKEEISEKNQCWDIYSAITDIYQLKPDRIRDWLSNPKANGYEALHLTVMGNGGNWIEVQIRSRRMDDIAQKGLASHFYYKSKEHSQLDDWLLEMRETLKEPNTDALSFLEDFRLNLYANEIQVFTPKGELHSLPQGATALDFAYKIHTDIGNTCIGAKVNKKLLPASHVLKSGDQVEILTSEKQTPLPEWLDIITTARAKSKIKWVLKEQRRKLIREGEEELKRIFEKNGLVLGLEFEDKLLNKLGLRKKEQLYTLLAQNALSEKDFKDALEEPKKQSTYWSFNFLKKNKKDKPQASVFGEVNRKETLYLDEENLNNTYKIADCCHPIPGDEVIGYLDFSNEVIIHKRKCTEALRLSSSQGDRLIDAKWETHRLKAYLTVIRLEGVDSKGLINEITTLISKVHDVNMQALRFETTGNVFNGEIKLYIYHTKDLNNLIGKLMKLKGIKQVRRSE